jgi:hypothetical protein
MQAFPRLVHPNARRGYLICIYFAKRSAPLWSSVIGTLAVTDTQEPISRPTDEIEHRPKRLVDDKAEGQDQPEDAALSAGRTVGGLALLALAALAVICIC